jgi:hypothetical protein
MDVLDVLDALLDDDDDDDAMQYGKQSSVPALLHMQVTPHGSAFVLHALFGEHAALWAQPTAATGGGEGGGVLQLVTHSKWLVESQVQTTEQPLVDEPVPHSVCGEHAAPCAQLPLEHAGSEAGQSEIGVPPPGAGEPVDGAGPESPGAEARPLWPSLEDGAPPEETAAGSELPPSIRPPHPARRRNSAASGRRRSPCGARGDVERSQAIANDNSALHVTALSRGGKFALLDSGQPTHPILDALDAQPSK